MFSSSGKKEEALTVPEWKGKPHSSVSLPKKSSVHPSGTSWQLTGMQLEPTQLGQICRHLKTHRCSHQQSADKELVQILLLQAGLQIKHSAVNQHLGFLLKLKHWEIDLDLTWACSHLQQQFHWSYCLPLQQQRLGANQCISDVVYALANCNVTPNLLCHIFSVPLLLFYTIFPPLTCLTVL